jgi:hypothetical protein
LLLAVALVGLGHALERFHLLVGAHETGFLCDRERVRACRVARGPLGDHLEMARGALRERADDRVVHRELVLAELLCAREVVLLEPERVLEHVVVRHLPGDLAVERLHQCDGRRVRTALAVVCLTEHCEQLSDHGKNRMVDAAVDLRVLELLLERHHLVRELLLCLDIGLHVRLTLRGSLVDFLVLALHLVGHERIARGGDIGRADLCLREVFVPLVDRVGLSSDGAVPFRHAGTCLRAFRRLGGFRLRRGLFEAGRGRELLR